ncbi:asparagine-rich protein, putative [Plasmodium chabaudi chabaudi]|uniref:Asparagine-rich protein, putative n=1 Tax=Plasmodium chabaudi chabaudi TaxID=31271 RepID=A0A1C6YTE0_PLACU|nr:asparagine-rich protein, putative [Plasmodium chabaudi chabaudi]
MEGTNSEINMKVDDQITKRGTIVDQNEKRQCNSDDCLDNDNSVGGNGGGYLFNLLGRLNNYKKPKSKSPSEEAGMNGNCDTEGNDNISLKENELKKENLNAGQPEKANAKKNDATKKGEQTPKGGVSKKGEQAQKGGASKKGESAKKGGASKKGEQPQKGDASKKGDVSSKSDASCSKGSPPKHATKNGELAKNGNARELKKNEDKEKLYKLEQNKNDDIADNNNSNKKNGGNTIDNTNSDSVMKLGQSQCREKIEELIKEIRITDGLYDDKNNEIFLLYTELYKYLIDLTDYINIGGNSLKKYIKEEIEKLKENNELTFHFLKNFKKKKNNILLNLNDSTLNEIKNSFFDNFEKILKGMDEESLEQYYNDLEESVMKNRNLGAIFIILCRNQTIYVLDDLYKNVYAPTVDNVEETNRVIKRLGNMNNFTRIIITVNVSNSTNRDNKINNNADRSAKNIIANGIKNNMNGTNNNIVHDAVENELSSVLQNGINNNMSMVGCNSNPNSNNSKNYLMSMSRNIQKVSEGINEDDQMDDDEFDERQEFEDEHSNLENKTPFSSLRNESNKLNFNKKTSNYFRKENNDAQVLLSACTTNVSSSFVEKKLREKNVKKKIMSNDTNSSKNNHMLFTDKSTSKSISYDRNHLNTNTTANNLLISSNSNDTTLNCSNMGSNNGTTNSIINNSNGMNGSNTSSNNGNNNTNSNMSTNGSTNLGNSNNICSNGILGGIANGVINNNTNINNNNCNSVSDNDYFSDMMVYISWVPKSARCQYPLELPKNSAERNKLAEYIEAKEQMLYILKLMGYEEIDNIYFHPPKGSHIKIKFKTLACMNKFLKAYKNTPDKWKEDMFNFFNIPLRSSISVRDLRIERAVPRSSTADFKKIKKINKNNHDLFLFKENYNLCQDSSTEKLEKINFQYDSYSKNIMGTVGSTGNSRCDNNSTSTMHSFMQGGNVKNNNSVLNNMATNNNIKKYNAGKKYFPKIKGFNNINSEYVNNSMMSNNSTFDDMDNNIIFAHDNNNADDVDNSVNVPCNNNMASCSGDGTSIMQNSRLYSVNNNRNNIGATTVMIPNGMIGNRNNTGQNISNTVSSSRIGMHNMKENGKYYFENKMYNHMNRGNIFNSNNLMPNNLNNDNFINTNNDDDGNNVHNNSNIGNSNMCINGKNENGKLNYNINHSATMFTSRNPSRNMYILKNKNMNRNGMGTETDTGGSSLLSASTFVNTNTGHSINKDIMNNNQSFSLKKQTHYASYSNNTNGNINGLNDHIFSYTTNNNNNLSLALNNRILNENSRNANNYSNRDLQNEAGNLTHFSTNIMDQNFEKEKNHLRKFKNCYMGSNTYNDNTMNNVDTNNNNNVDNNKVVNNNALENNNVNSSASIINGPLNNNNNNRSRSSSNGNMDRMINSCMHRLGNVKSHNNNSFCNPAFSSNLLNKKYMQNNHINNNNNNNDDIKEDFKNLINIDFINDIDMDYEEKSHHNITNDILTRNSNSHLHSKQGNAKRYIPLSNCLSDGLLENRAGNCTSSTTMKGRDYSMYENLSFNNMKDFGSIKDFKSLNDFNSIINDVGDKSNDINFNENDFAYPSGNMNNNLTNVCDGVNIDGSCVVMPDGFNNYFSDDKSNLYDNNKNNFFNYYNSMMQSANTGNIHMNQNNNMGNTISNKIISNNMNNNNIGGDNNNTNNNGGNNNTNSHLSLVNEASINDNFSSVDCVENNTHGSAKINNMNEAYY